MWVAPPTASILHYVLGSIFRDHFTALTPLAAKFAKTFPRARFGTGNTKGSDEAELKA